MGAGASAGAAPRLGGLRSAAISSSSTRSEAAVRSGATSPAWSLGDGKSTEPSEGSTRGDESCDAMRVPE